MTLIEFVADFQNAQQGIMPAGILNIKNGDYDGQFELLSFLPGGHNLQPFRIITAVQNVEEYPSGHEYVVFCEGDAPSNVVDLLQNVRETNRKTVFEFLNIISETICGSNRSGNSSTADRVESVTTEEEGTSTVSGVESATGSVAESVTPNKAESVTVNGTENVSVNVVEVKDDGDEDSANIATYKLIEELLMGKDEDMKVVDEDSSEYKDRLLADLRAAREAGFSVGLLGPITDLEYGCYGFFQLAIRMSELGISLEVLQSWEIDPNEYLILLIHYPKGYKTHEELQGYDRQGYDKTAIGMRVVAGKYDRAIMEEAVNAFIEVKGIKDYNVDETSTIRDIFISKQLSTLLEESLVPILRFRSTGMDWHGAEAWFSDLQGMDENADPDAIPDRYFEPETTDKVFPEVVTADHFASNNGTDYSFPLLAMQFVLRHFVRCTEFCLTCHRKLNLELEAIKPQTCERRRCLIQYLNLGLIEHEVISQPYVADLLVSFCYSSARAYKLKDFPDGLALRVPPVRHQFTLTAMTSTGSGSSSEPVEYDIGFDYDRLEITFHANANEVCPVKKDTWIVIQIKNSFETEYHCRVTETSLFPVVHIDEPIVLGVNDWPVTDKLMMPNWIPATMIKYDQDFDLLDRNQRCDAMCKLLDTLPSVKEMQNYLADRHRGDLKSWVQRLSPAALRLFRWIIATNRACITTVDGDNALFTKGDRLYGMRGYMQFRFAMGAPDKEQRFLNEVKKTTERLNLQYPTIFAWHGSLLHNWHMIIREGLNFNSMVNGRAYGDGVYHAVDARTSEGYSGMHNNLVMRGTNPTVNSGIRFMAPINTAVQNPFNFPQNGANFLQNTVSIQQNVLRFPQNNVNTPQNAANNFPQNVAYLQQNSINNAPRPTNNFFPNTFNYLPPPSNITTYGVNNVNTPSNTTNFAPSNGYPSHTNNTVYGPMSLQVNNVSSSQNGITFPQSNVAFPQNGLYFPLNSSNFPQNSFANSQYGISPQTLTTNTVQLPSNSYNFPSSSGNAVGGVVNAASNNVASHNVTSATNNAPQIINLAPKRINIPLNNGNSWPNSVLNISGALALNEIVNAPKEFVSSNPFYVVRQLDWIQTRYLFVKCNPIEGVHIGQEQMPADPHPQDPKRTPTGVSGPIVIPSSAIKSGRGLDPPAATAQTLQKPTNAFGEASGFGTAPAYTGTAYVAFPPKRKRGRPPSAAPKTPKKIAPNGN